LRMARRKRTVKPLPTIWHVPDELWQHIEPLLNELDPPAKTGRKRIAPRPALDGIIYQMRTGCQWNDDKSKRKSMRNVYGVRSRSATRTC
jgi:transposase